MPPKRKPVDHVAAGEVYMVEKEKVMPAQAIELSHTKAEKLLRPKAPRTEAQIANTKRLVEFNRQRAAEWRKAMDSGAEPSRPAPVQAASAEDRVPIKVKPKRPYNRKVPAYNSDDARAVSVERPPAPSSRAPARHLAREPVQETYTEDEEDDVVEELPARPVRAARPAPPPRRTTKKVRATKAPRPASRESYYSEEESETDLTTDTDSDMERVQRYVKKATRRMDAVKKIDEQIRSASNKYMAAGLSIFN